MRRLVPVAVALLLASCAPAPSPDLSREQPQPASESAEPSPIVVSSSSPAAIAAPSDQVHPTFPLGERLASAQADFDCDGRRSEEHTSELQSQSNLACRLLLEKKK